MQGREVGPCLNWMSGGSVMPKLRIQTLELVGGGRQIAFPHRVNVVRGQMTTGKTTLVRLLRALLGSVPDNLAPETGVVQALRAEVEFDTGRWQIYRPLVMTDTAKVGLARIPDSIERSDRAADLDPLEALRLPAVRPDSPAGPTYSRWLLAQLGLPSVEVPRARTQPTSETVPVTINDWMGYCIVPGDEIDTSVFGHDHPFRDIKRRYVFELIYGLYDAETAKLQNDLREVELRRGALGRQAEAAVAFLAGTAFADPDSLTGSITEARVDLHDLAAREAKLAKGVHDRLGTAALRDRVQAAEHRVAGLRAEVARTRDQLADLRDLRTQLVTQSSRLTRAIVAGEWLVDFDFIVCPRCGNDVTPDRAPDPDSCYLCLQPLKPSESRDSLLAEQERVAAQVQETDEVFALREYALEQACHDLDDAQAAAHALSVELDNRTRAFINEQTSALAYLAAERARLEAQIQRAEEYLAVLRRQADLDERRAQLDSEREELLAALDRRGMSHTAASDHITALEQRLYEYLEQLHVPLLGEALSAAIDRKTLLPIVSGRRFEELSSQGLEVLVNVAHALAHHTVAIDRGLPLPGFLVLDGLSSNVGREGFDAARVEDMYRLLLSVADTYGEELQLIAVDNDPPHFIDDFVVLSLEQDDRLIRTTTPPLSTVPSS